MDTYKIAEEREREKLDDLVDNWEDILSGTISGTTTSEIKSQITGKEESPTKVLINEKGVVIPPKFRIADDSGEKVEDGIVVIDPQGNEWVWIPCYVSGGKGSGISNNIKFDRYAFSRNGWLITQTKSAEKDADGSFKIMRADKPSDRYFYEALSTTSDEYNSIKKYGGFYIGRYEAGYIEKDENKTLVIQKDKPVYVDISKVDCVTKSQELTSSDGSDSTKLDGREVFTKLCSSYAWDTAIKFIEKTHLTYGTTSKDKDGNIAGNYESDGVINTGKTIPVCNIYDMGGNAWEYTTEFYNNPTAQEWVFCNRGGQCIDKALEFPSAARDVYNGKEFNGGTFRPTLYVK